MNISALPIPEFSIEAARLHGFNCGLFGADNENSHFAIFASSENTEAWEKGMRQGEKFKKLFIKES